MEDTVDYEAILRRDLEAVQEAYRQIVGSDCSELECVEWEDDDTWQS